MIGRSNDDGNIKDAKPKRAPMGRGQRVALVLCVWVVCVALAAIGFVAYTYWQQQDSYDQVAAVALSGVIEQLDELDGLDEDPEATEGENEEAVPDVLYDITLDWDALAAINSDIVGWVYIPGTRINYPIVQTSDNDYYLHYNFDGARASNYLPTAGTPFLLASNSSDFSDGNNIIQAHNMANGTMFHDIGTFRSSSVFNEHRRAYVFTPQGNYELIGISVLVIPTDDELVQTKFASDEEYADFVSDVMAQSVVSVSGWMPDASEVGKTFMFATCKQAGSNYRTVAVYAVCGYAALVEDEAEDVTDAVESW